MTSLQAPPAVVIMWPHQFRSNTETQGGNAFQILANSLSGTISAQALADFGSAVVPTGKKRILALSVKALDALRPEQIAEIERSAEPLPLTIPTIETAGGSVRCMLTGIHLSPRERTSA